jgi:hypothetical protein
MPNRSIQAVGENFRSEVNRAYIDIQETQHIGGPNRMLTQDTTLFLVALSENSTKDNLVDGDEWQLW